MTKRSKIIVVILLLAVAAVPALYFLLRSEGKPKCDCIFPNSGTYGVIKEGRCVKTDCAK